MKAFGKILGLVLLGSLLIIVALGFALSHLFDPNDYKDEIRQIARDKAHIELTLNGNIGWSLFPWLGLELHDASVATLAAPNRPFANLQMLGLSVRVLPLLHKEIKMSNIRVEGLSLRLTRNKGGQGNWQDIGQPSSAIASTDISSTSTEIAKKPDSVSQPLKLNIDSLTVNNAQVVYNDEKSGQQFSAEGIQLSIGPIQEATSTPVKLTAFLGTNKPVMRVKTEINGKLRFDHALKRYQFEDMKMVGEASGEPLQGKTMTYAAQGQILVDLAANVAEWRGLKASANQLHALGELKASALDGTPQISGGLSIGQLNLAAFLDSIGHTLPQMRPGSLSRVKLVSRLSGSPTSLAFNELTLKVDDSTFTGRIAIDDFTKMALRIKLKGDTFDADRYLPPRTAAANKTVAARRTEVHGREISASGTSGDTPLPDAPTTSGWSTTKIIPVTRLRVLDLEADLSFDQLRLTRLPIQNAALKFSSKDGLLILQNFSGNLYKGALAAKGGLDLRHILPLTSLNIQINDVPVERILRSQGQKSPVISKLTLDGKFTSSGNNQNALIQSLSGTTNFVFNNGVLLNANLEQQLCKGISVLNRKTLSDTPVGKNTPLKELKGSLVFRNGVASNPDMIVRIPGMSLKGNGSIDLRVLGMDYRVGIIIEGDTSGMPDPACQVSKNFVGIELPLRCRGPLELGAKACRLDKQALSKVAIKVAGKKINEKLEEKLGDTINPELRNALKGLFNR